VEARANEGDSNNYKPYASPETIQTANAQDSLMIHGDSLTQKLQMDNVRVAFISSCFHSMSLTQVT
jgi:hypothetical protein